MSEHAGFPDVVIVGAGPVGLMLACELAVAGAGVLVLERADGFDSRLRAPGISTRTVEALDRRGMLDALIAAVAEDGPQIGRGPDGTAPPELPIFPGRLERVLCARLVALGGTVEFGHEVTGLHAHADAVSLAVRTSRGRDRNVRAGYVVGCDGGRSLVRKHSGIGFSGAELDIVGYQAVATVEAPEEPEPGWRRTSGGLTAFTPAADRIVTVEWNRPRAEHRDEVTLAEVQESFRRTSGTNATLSAPRSLTRFTGGCRIAERYRRGRVLLAGDAAHVHPPFGGQGLNLGMQDAVNLGWKLAATVQGWAPPGLLDTYQDERRPVGERALRNCRAVVSLLNPDEANTPAYEFFTAELMADRGVKRRLREVFAMTDARYPLGDDELPGTALPDLTWTIGGTRYRLADFQQEGRGVLAAPAGSGHHRDLAGWQGRVDGVPVPAEALPGCDAVLVRPDGYVAWAGTGSRRSGLTDSLRRWFGEPASTGG